MSNETSGKGDVTIYADGVKNIEVIHIASDPRAPGMRVTCDANPGNASEPQSFKLRRGDFLIVRIEE